MLGRPAEPSRAPGHLADGDAVRTFRRTWSTWRDPARAGSWSARLRSAASKIAGRPERRLLSSVAGATDAVAAGCDALSDRLESQEALTAEVAETLGEEVSRLRAEVAHLRRLLDARDGASPHG